MVSFNHFNLRAPLELLEQLKEFYCDIVGLSVGDRPPFNRFGYWLYAGDNAILHLVQDDEQEVSAESRTSFDHVAFSCENRPHYQDRLEQNGVDFRIAHVPMTGQVQLFIQDPAGNGVELNFIEETNSSQ